jgi:predicted DNA-binding protein (MmcQ/YjbR family)
MSDNSVLQKTISYCSAKEDAVVDFPFGDDVMVFKVKNKMFALIGLKERIGINLKCDPAYAELLRIKYEAVIPGYHMNKKHWNTVNLDGTLSTDLLFEWIDDSYDLVLKRKK